MTIARTLRLAALAIAVAALIDPAVTTARRSAALVAVVPADPGTDSALAARVAVRLEDAFAVVRGALPAASATVLVGQSLPADATALAAPVFAVLPAPDDPALTLRGLEGPGSAPLHARVSVTATVDIRGGAGLTLLGTLRVDGVEVDRAVLPVDSARQRLRLPLAFIPRAEGAHLLSVDVTLAGTGRSAVRRQVVDVRQERWAVLFHDARPAWLSTFVRRALEQDPRFAVSTRVATAPGVATVAGEPPGRLGQADALDAFDAVVVGAPEGLSSADVAGLERYMRRRGGAVLLLMDRQAGGPYERLAGGVTWSAARHDAPVRIRGTPASMDGGPLRAAELVWPAALPAGARAVAVAEAARMDGGDAAVLWRSPVGGGRLLVSGALDAWRYRGDDLEAFERFWRTLIGEGAAAAPPQLAMVITTHGATGVAAPGAWQEVELTLREPVLADPAAGGTMRASVSGRVRAAEGNGGPDAAIRFWPDGPPGRLRATLRAPATPGTYYLEAVADGRRTALPLVVRDEAERAVAEPGLMAAWAASRGGAALPEDQLEVLPAALRERLDDARRREQWHPMRSPWWILPFAALLGGEWFWRRRHGLP